MCELMEKYNKEAADKAIFETSRKYAFKLFAKNMSFEEVSSIIDDVSESELRELYNQYIENKNRQ